MFGAGSRCPGAGSGVRPQPPTGSGLPPPPPPGEGDGLGVGGAGAFGVRNETTPEYGLSFVPSVACTRQYNVRDPGRSPGLIVVVPPAPGVAVTTAACGWSSAVPISKR